MRFVVESCAGTVDKADLLILEIPPNPARKSDFQQTVAALRLSAFRVLSTCYKAQPTATGGEDSQ